MTTQNPRGGPPQDDVTDLVRNVALSSAKLWEDVLHRLDRVERKQADIDEKIANVLAGPVGMPSIATSSGTRAALPAAPVTVDVGSGGPATTDGVGAPPPPPPGFGTAGAPPPPPGFVGAAAAGAASTIATAPPPPSMSTAPPPPPSTGPATPGVPEPLFFVPDLADDAGAAISPNNVGINQSAAPDAGLLPPPAGGLILPPPPPGGAAAPPPPPPGFDAGGAAPPPPPPGFAGAAAGAPAPGAPVELPPFPAPPGFTGANPEAAGTAEEMMEFEPLVPPPPGFENADDGSAPQAMAADPGAPAPPPPPPTGFGAPAPPPPPAGIDAPPPPPPPDGANPGAVPALWNPTNPKEKPRHSVVEPLITPDFFARSSRRKR